MPTHINIKKKDHKLMAGKKKKEKKKKERANEVINNTRTY